MAKGRRSRLRWVGGAAILLVLASVAVTAYVRPGDQDGSQVDARLQAYADSRPGLVFVYTTRPHLMPDGTSMY